MKQIEQIHHPIIISLCVCLLSCLSLPAQNTTNLPTSMYGIGELCAGEGGRYAGLGNIGIALNRPGFVNTLNPAAITAMDTISFTFDIGLSASYARYSFLSDHSSNLTGNPNRLSLGFRLLPRWYALIGAAPYSSVGYLIQTEEDAKDMARQPTDLFQLIDQRRRGQELSQPRTIPAHAHRRRADYQWRTLDRQRGLQLRGLEPQHVGLHLDEIRKPAQTEPGRYLPYRTAEGPLHRTDGRHRRQQLIHQPERRKDVLPGGKRRDQLPPTRIIPVTGSHLAPASQPTRQPDARKPLQPQPEPDVRRKTHQVQTKIRINYRTESLAT